jgi:putative cell wall-binding protein
LSALAGNDRFETSANTAREFGPATGVILASGEAGRTPDALAAAFLAGVRDVPVLLTRRDTTPAPVLAELQARRAQGATRITVVGGAAAISSAQLGALRELGFEVDRLDGRDRYETARSIVAAGATSASTTGLVASGVSTIDALAGGPLAFKGKHPLFLVTRDGIPAATLEAMRTARVSRVYILGGGERRRAAGGGSARGSEHHGRQPAGGC